ncbi:trypsin-like serine protease [Qipengyuania sp. DGS5-3]|uniref:trypsin-like serine protease n=1 Tax=Qipengyuania sp. DGS5-3 TaxID=3349632 RepID=UPI0036D2E908
MARANVPEADVQSDERSSTIVYNNFSDEESREAKRAARKNRKACLRGDAEACVAAGYAYLRGEGVGQIGDIADILFGEACDAGLVAGCNALGKFHAGEGGDPKNYPKAATAFERACDLGDLTGCRDFADLLRRDVLGAPDPARADLVIEAACEAGSNDACFDIANAILRQEQWTEERVRAERILDAQCREGLVNACYRAVEELKARSYRDEWQIGEFLHIACYFNDVAACFEMGERVYRGIGVAPDRSRSISYYDQLCNLYETHCEISKALRVTPSLYTACADGNFQSCADLGRALALPGSPETDRDTAIGYLESSCVNGVTDACADASEQMRAHFSSDNAEGAQRLIAMLERACSAEDLSKCFELAEIYKEGSWAVADVAQAGRLFNELCTKGMDEACVKEVQFSGIVPEARIAVADAEYMPPEDADEPTQVPQERLVVEAPPPELSECVTSRERFRGQVYTQTNCPAHAAAINSYALKRGQAPWQALLWRPKRLVGQTLREADRVLCGGSLIAKGWVLTAAHCLIDNGTRIRTAGHRVRLGVYNPRKPEGITYPIIRTIAHPQYNPRNKYVFDIALVQYDYRAGSAGARTNKIASIKLDPLQVGKRRIAKGMNAYSYGWGWTQAANSQSTEYLQGVKMQLRSEGACTRFTKFRGNLRHAALCAGGRNFQQTCYGDSGGPLVYYGDAGRRPTLIGVVSSGKKCGSTGLPSQYTRVAKAKSWIASYVRGIR